MSIIGPIIVSDRGDVLAPQIAIVVAPSANNIEKCRLGVDRRSVVLMFGNLHDDACCSLKIVSTRNESVAFIWRIISLGAICRRWSNYIRTVDWVVSIEIKRISEKGIICLRSSGLRKS